MQALTRFLVIALAACHQPGTSEPGGTPPSDSGTTSQGPLEIRSVAPTLGSVAGGTRLVVTGAGWTPDVTIFVGDVPCAPVTVEDASTLSCMTGSSDFHEGAMDVVVTRGMERVVLPAGFTYQCLWQTTTGRRSCGAAPPGFSVAPQPIAGWLTQFQDAGTYSVTSDAPFNLADHTDFVLGTQSMSFDTDGRSVVSMLHQAGSAAVDFTDKDFKIWIKVEGVAHLTALDVWLGDSNLHNHFGFALRSSQGQQFMTDGDWVSFTVPWSPENFVIAGAPNRAAISELAVRAADDGTGNPVRIHLNGIAAVPEPVTRYPHGVVSFTFDDGWATAAAAGAPILAAHHFPATAYVIVDVLGKSNRMTLADLHDLQSAGWDVAVHANTDLHHFARYPSLAPAVLEDDIVDARAWLIENGFKGYDHCAYPGGEFSGGTDVLGPARRYFASCRTIFEKQRETYPPSDPHKLRVLLVVNSTPLATVEQMVDDAKQAREWLILVFHKIGPSTTDSIEWSSENLAALADYVSASGIDVQPMTAVLH